MANTGPQPSRTRPPTMTLPQGQVIARYPTYALAQRAVDHLSDNRLPVQAVTIVGTDLRVVERVTGRLTYGRVALQGALSGAWFGLLIGILLSLASQSGAGVGVGVAMLFGAGFGLLFAVISYATTRGRRDFTSRSEIVAGEYQLVCADGLVAQASELLARLPTSGARVDLPPPAPGQGSAGPANGTPNLPPPAWPPVDGPARPTAPASWPPSPGQPAAAQPAQPSPAPQPQPTGPTYSEMIEKQKRERLERERREREEAQAARQAQLAPPPQDRPEGDQG